jgi:hypothetical protein
VAKAVVFVEDEREPLLSKNVELVAALVFVPPELIVGEEKVLCLSAQVGMCSVVKIFGELKGGKILMDLLNLVVCLAQFYIIGKGSDGVNSGLDLGAEDPHCKGLISV